jgi:dethiobiotin synthetase
MSVIGIIGIHTGIGKTICSSILTEAYQADYWKPIQAGDLENSDSITVKRLISNTTSIIHPEVFKLNQAMSPHAAAKRDQVDLCLDQIQLPQYKKRLIVETAGGLYSPINDKQTIIDLIMHLNIPVILVSQNYLGSINHSMMSIKLLQANAVMIKGIIFNDKENKDSESFILENSGLPYLTHIPQFEELNVNNIKIEAEKLFQKLPYLFSV